MLAHKFWQRRFNARSVRRRQAPDVRRRGLRGDRRDAAPPSRTATATSTCRCSASSIRRTRGNHFLATYARLKTGVPLDRATREMRALGETLAREYGYNHGIDVRSYREVVVGQIRGPLQVLMGAVLCVLLIACANVANCCSRRGWRGGARSRSGSRSAPGRRTSRGSSRAEALVLAAAGGTLGLLLAIWIVRVFVVARRQQPAARLDDPGGRAGARRSPPRSRCSSASSAACRRCIRLRLKTLTTALREGDTRTGSGGGATFGNGLVDRRDRGRVRAARRRRADGEEPAAARTPRRRHHDRSRHRVRHLADRDRATRRAARSARSTATLQSASRRSAACSTSALTSHLPMYRFGNNGEMTREGGNPWGASENPLVEYRYLHGDYLKALGIPVLRGRALDSRDGADTNGVLINQAMADKFWPGEDPDRQALRAGQGSQDVLHGRRRDRQHPLVRPGGADAVRVLSHDRSGAVQLDDGRAALDRASSPSSLIPSARVDRRHARSRTCRSPTCRRWRRW